MSEIDVLFEDSQLLILDKPPGIAVHPGRGHPPGSTMIDRALARLRWKERDPFRPAFVHRLDRDTSGVLVLAKSPEALRTINRAIKMKKVRKTYLALVKGALPPEGSIRMPLSRERDDEARLDVVKAGGPRGIRARTDYRTLEVRRTGDPLPPLSLVEAMPITGRTHQIRAHFAACGHPIAGDALYGDAPLNAAAARVSGLARQFLHASRIELSHPAAGDPIRIEAPLAQDLRDTLARLGFRAVLGYRLGAGGGPRSR